MELEDILKKRLIELVNITNKLSSKNSVEQEEHQKLILEIQASGDTEEDKVSNSQKINKIKKLNSFIFLRLKEIDINIRILNELYSLLKVMDIEVELDDEAKNFLKFNSENFKPTFILDKGELVFFNTEIESFILSELDKNVVNESEIIANIKKASK